LSVNLNFSKPYVSGSNVVVKKSQQPTFYHAGPQRSYINIPGLDIPGQVNASICQCPEAENPLVMKTQNCLYDDNSLGKTFHFKYNIREKARTTSVKYCLL
jgi:hypothetical protein